MSSGRINDINIEFLKSRLDTNIIARSIYYFDEIDSTNEYAKFLAEENQQEGIVVIADHQKSGKGRLDRKWFSPGKVNLYISIILKPDISIMEANIVTFISSISTVDTISKYGIQSDIKWPNDVVIRGKKISGVLTEINLNKQQLDYVVVGIGVNINLTKEHLQEHENLSDTATSLFIETGNLIERNDFLLNFLMNIEKTYHEYLDYGKIYIIEKWLTKWNGLNQQVLVNLDSRTLSGICRGIDDNGYLIVEKSNGEYHTVIAGDVTLLGR